MTDLTDVVSWSHSAMSTYETCPQQYWWQYRSGQYKYQSTAETAYGNAVHKALEMRGRDGVPMPTNMAQYDIFIRAVLARPGRKVFEQKMALDKELRPVDYFAKENGKSIVWLRGSVDVLNFRDDIGVVEVFDWKTGKRKDDRDQLMLYAMMVMLHYPEVRVVRAGYCWLKEPPASAFTAPVEYPRKILDDMIAIQQAKYRGLKYAADTNYFPPRPSGLCNGWCSNTTCEHWKPKRA